MDDPVQAQLEAYNRHDVAGFVACYSEDAVIRLADGRVLMRGREEIRSRYAALFAAHPDLSVEVPTRIRAGGWTVDEEKVQRGKELLHVIVGYLVRGGLISAVVMMRSVD